MNVNFISKRYLTKAKKILEFFTNVKYFVELYLARGHARRTVRERLVHAARKSFHWRRNLKEKPTLFKVMKYEKKLLFNFK
jgi:hypothetical protein